MTKLVWLTWFLLSCLTFPLIPLQKISQKLNQYIKKFHNQSLYSNVPAYARAGTLVIAQKLAGL